MSYDKKLNILKENLEKAKDLKYKAEARLEQLNKQEEDILLELKELEVSPEDLDKEIEKLTREIEKLFDEANNLIPIDLLERK